MLVLSRERNGVIVIILPSGQEITVAIVDVRGDKVRLGFTAPADVSIHRHEVWEKIKQKRTSGA